MPGGLVPFDPDRTRGDSSSPRDGGTANHSSTWNRAESREPGDFRASSFDDCPRRMLGVWRHRGTTEEQPIKTVAVMNGKARAATAGPSGGYGPSRDGTEKFSSLTSAGVIVLMLHRCPQIQHRFATH
jgi:hypothetical protein